MATAERSLGPLPTAGRKHAAIAAFTVAAILLHLFLLIVVDAKSLGYGLTLAHPPLLAALAFGGVPLALELLVKGARGEFGSDLLAGISIVTAVLLGEYLAGAALGSLLTHLRADFEKIFRLPTRCPVGRA